MSLVQNELPGHMLVPSQEPVELLLALLYVFVFFPFFSIVRCHSLALLVILNGFIVNIFIVVFLFWLLHYFLSIFIVLLENCFFDEVESLETKGDNDSSIISVSQWQDICVFHYHENFYQPKVIIDLDLP